MESNYSNREFEQHIKENADQFRMFPSDKVWKSVHSALHTRRKWYGFGLAFLLLLTGASVTWVMTAYPVSKKQNVATLNTNEENIAFSAKSPAEVSSAPQTIEDIIPFTSTPAERTTENIRSSYPATSITAEEILNSVTDADLTARLLSRNNVRTKDILDVDGVTPPSVSTPDFSITSIPSQQKPAETAEFVLQEPAKDANSLTNYQLLTIESVTAAYQHKALPRKISWQIFVTPTVSYRKLSVNNSYDKLSDVMAGGANYPFASIKDVNKAVTHKPDLGFQIGVAAKYPLTKNLRLIGGLQANVNRYDIKAFAYNGEIATINLSAGPGSNNSVSTWTRYRNFTGYRSDWLKNFYLSVSAPIGAELTLVGNKKTNWGIAGTVQPTYILSDRAYMISTDFKNYAKVPWLIRHMNVSSSFETFINYTNGKTRWQVGPQVRYQMLSSFKNKYPVKENLFDFGVKLGVSIN